MEKCLWVDVGGWLCGPQVEGQYLDRNVGGRVCWGILVGGGYGGGFQQKFSSRLLSMWRVSIGKEVLRQGDKVLSSSCRN